MSPMTQAARVERIKGCERLLTQEDIAGLIGRSVKFVRQRLLKSGVLPSTKLGGNTYRVRPSDFNAFIDRGNAGFRSAASSGRFRSNGGSK